MKQNIQAILKTHMQSRNSLGVETCRSLLNAIQQAEISNGRQLSDKEVQEVVSKQAKQRRESIAAFQASTNSLHVLNLISKEKAELEIILQFLPKQVSQEEIVLQVDKVINELSQNGSISLSNKDMGKIVNVLKTHFAGSADMGLVSKIVKEKLVN